MSRCLRVGLSEYMDSFLPVFMTSHLQKSSVEDYLSRSVSHFMVPTHDIEATFDGSCSMKLTTHAVFPKRNEVIKSKTLITDRKVLKIDSLAIAILGLSIIEIKRMAMKYLVEVLDNGSFKMGNAMLKSILDVLLHFRSDKPLLQHALLLVSIQHFMSRTLFLTDSSASLVCRELGVPSSTHMFSRLLERQIKCVMLKIQSELLKETLDQLEKCLRSRTVDSWPTSFAVILLLCICAEEMQTAAISAVTTEVADGATPPAATDATRACIDVEEVVASRLQPLFHDIYKTQKEPREGGFNPLRDGPLDERLGRDETRAVKEFQQLMRDSSAEIEMLNKPADFQASPEEFEKKNWGRLVSQFLLSFYVNER